MCPVSCIQMWMGFWRLKVNRYACLNTHMRTRVYAHLPSRTYACAPTQKCSTDVDTGRVNTRVVVRVSPSVVRVYFNLSCPSIFRPENLHAFAMLTNAAVSFSQWIFKKVKKKKKRMFPAGQSTKKKERSSRTCPFTACEGTVLYGDINLCRSTFSAQSLSSLILFHIPLAVYGL